MPGQQHDDASSAVSTGRIKELIAEHYTALTAIAYAAARGPSAPDLLHDCIARMVAKESTFEVPSGTGEDKAFLAWFGRVLHNRAIDHQRRDMRARRHSVELDTIPTDYLPGQPALQGEAFACREALAILDRELKPSSRRIIDLMILQGKRYQDVAAELGIAIGTIKSRLYRAREEATVILARHDFTL